MSEAHQSREPRSRRPRDREATTKDLLAAARRLLARDGVLAGLNLREVADEAGVNRGSIYQYFGSRQELLRAALAEVGWARADVFEEGRELPFAARRALVFEEALRYSEFIKLEALLALDGDTELRIFPQLDRTRHDHERDRATGELGQDADAVAWHLMTAAIYLGYSVFRDNFVRESGIPSGELDSRALAVVRQMLTAVPRSGSPNVDGEASNPGH